MERINLAQLFQEELSNMPQVKEGITCHEAVRQCLPEIKKCRKRKIPWDQISEIVKAAVQKGYDLEINLTGNTVRFYYYELTSKKGSKHSSVTHDRSSKNRKPKSKDKENISGPNSTTKKVKEEPSLAKEVLTSSVEVKSSSKSTEESMDSVDAVSTQTSDHSKSTQSDPYQRPPGSRFTKGYKVKYWNGENP